MILRWWTGRRRCAFCREPLPAEAVRVGRRNFCSEKHADRYRFARALARTRRDLGGSGGGGCCQ